MYVKVIGWPASEGRLEGELTYSVQRGSSSEIWQESNLKKVEEEILVFYTIDTVQEKDHGCFMVWTETCWHVWLHNYPIWESTGTQKVMSKNILKYFKNMLQMWAQ